MTTPSKQQPVAADLTDEQMRAIEDYARALVTVDFWSGKVLASVILDKAYEARSKMLAALGSAPATPVPANKVQARAMELHEKASMPWREAERLALSEAGIDEAAVDELIGECGSMGLETLLADADSLRDFTRSVLVHQPLATPVQPVPASSPKCRDCADFGPICPNSGKPCAAPTAPASAPATQDKGEGA